MASTTMAAPHDERRATLNNKNVDTVFDPFSPGDDAETQVSKATTAEESLNTKSLAPFDEFDPFGIDPYHGASGDQSVRSKSQSSKGPAEGSKTSIALPPRMVVKFSIHEEVSSVADVLHDSEGASQVIVRGTLHAQVTSSDALKNLPFILVGSGQRNSKMTFAPNEAYSKVHTNKDGTSKINVVKVPKNILGLVPIGTYTIQETISHMPLLLERKVTRIKSYIQIAIQVRSKLTNQADLMKFSVVVALDAHIAPNSVEIMAGEGEYDEMKRTVTWNLLHLPRGESFMVSARARVHEYEGESNSTEDFQFPVMLRCSSHDQISTAQFQAVEASGYPASISYSTLSESFRMLHRLA